jgi:hypothetical protein
LVTMVAGVIGYPICPPSRDEEAALRILSVRLPRT